MNPLAFSFEMQGSAACSPPSFDLFSARWCPAFWMQEKIPHVEQVHKGSQYIYIYGR
jgi:hypothetical protein